MHSEAYEEDITKKDWLQIFYELIFTEVLQMNK